MITSPNSFMAPTSSFESMAIYIYTVYITFDNSHSRKGRHPFEGTSGDVFIQPWLLGPPHGPHVLPCSSLQLGDTERCRAADVQEEGALLLGEEGGGDDVVDAGRDVFQLQVAETAPAEVRGETCLGQRLGKLEKDCYVVICKQ